MAIFNENYIMEMKSKEEYARISFKKKYDFKPDKPGSNTGTITVDGKKYNIDIRNRKYKVNKNQMKNIIKDAQNSLKEDPKVINTVVKGKGKIFTKSNYYSNNEPGEIILDKKYFKLKGSNNNERRDAILQHEIGHQHDKNKYYQKDDDNKSRNNAHKIASKYNNEYVNDDEFIADRYSANKTSESANKKALRNYVKLDKKDNNKQVHISIDKNGKLKIATPKEEKKEKHRYNTITQSMMKQRNKALKDNELRKYKG